MTEKSPESTASTSDKTTNSGDTINVLPILSEAKAPVSVTLTLDRSTGKIAAWIIGVIVGLGAMIGAGMVLAVVMIIEWRAAQMEARVKAQEVIYLQAAVIAHGIPIPHPPGNDPKPEEEKQP